MSRIDPARFRTTPNHFDMTTNLFAMLIDLETTVKAGELVGVVQREQIILTITAAVDDLSKCRDSILVHETAVRRYNHHIELIDYLEKIKNLVDGDLSHIDFREGRVLIGKLDDCRTDRAFY